MIIINPEGYGRNVINTLRFVTKNTEFPLILGREFCGVVIAKGQKVRDDIQVGEKVWGVVSPQSPGSQAEFVVVNQSTVSFRNLNSKFVEIIIHSLLIFVRNRR